MQNSKLVENCCAVKNKEGILTFFNELIIYVFSLTAELPLNGHCLLVQHLSGGDLMHGNVNGNTTEVESGDHIGNVGVSSHLGYLPSFWAS